MTETKHQRARKRWKLAHPERRKADRLVWWARNPKRKAWLTHRAHAKARSIEFVFTFEAWLQWWGDDYDKRGRGGDDLCMGRKGDTGPYEIGNVYKTTIRENAIEAQRTPTLSSEEERSDSSDRESC